MKLEDIANLLAGKINQSHYIKHYLSNVFMNGFQKGVENKENFAIGFSEWVDKIGLSPCDSVDYNLYLSHTITELLEIYKKHYENNQDIIQNNRAKK